MLLTFLLALVLTTPQAGARWERVNTNENISFLFPNSVEKLTDNKNGIPSTIYQTKDLACVFGVVCSDFGAKKIDLSGENALMIYAELKKGSVSMETARIKDEKTIPYDNMLIKEIEYTVIKDRYEMTYYKRFIFRENYVYQISIGGRTRHTDVIQKEKEIFFNSITFQDTATK